MARTRPYFEPVSFIARHAARRRAPPRATIIVIRASHIRSEENPVPNATASPSKGLNIGLWIAQVLLMLAFGAAGGMKLFNPAVAEMAKTQSAMPYALTYFIGTSEVLGAIGVVLPAATRIQPKLTGWAAVGLGTIMVLAFALHLSRGEWSHVPPVAVLGALAAFVAWGRLKKAPISPR
jgi:putative oxidoreductase